jgi:hypothetical protein
MVASKERGEVVLGFWQISQIRTTDLKAGFTNPLNLTPTLNLNPLLARGLRLRVGVRLRKEWQEERVSAFLGQWNLSGFLNTLEVCWRVLFLEVR